MSMHRERTRRIRIGDERTGIVEVGGGAPVALQTMTTSFTHDVEASVAEINRLHAAGADIVRVAVPEKKDTEALPEILGRTSVPIVADCPPLEAGASSPHGFSNFLGDGGSSASLSFRGSRQ